MSLHAKSLSVNLKSLISTRKTSCNTTDMDRTTYELELLIRLLAEMEVEEEALIMGDRREAERRGQLH